MELNQGENLVDNLPEKAKKELYVLYVIGNTDSKDSYISNLGKNLASKLGMTEESGRTRVNRSKSDLIEKGLVEEEKDGNKFLNLTDKGEEILEIISPLFSNDKREWVREPLTEVFREENRGSGLYDEVELSFEEAKRKVRGKLDKQLTDEELERYINSLWSECKKKVKGEKWERRSENSEKILGSDD